MKKMLFLLLTLCSFSAFSQETEAPTVAVQGRNLVGIDISPFTGIFIQNGLPRFSLMLKREVKPGSTNRLRAGLSVFQDKNFRFGNAYSGNYRVDTGYYVRSYAGEYDQGHLFVGIEGTVKKNIITLFYGADVFAGIKNEKLTQTKLNFRDDVREPDGVYVGRQTSQTAIRSTIFGLAPFLGFDVNLTESIVFSTHIQLEATYEKRGKITDSMDLIPNGKKQVSDLQLIPARFFLYFKF